MRDEKMARKDARRVKDGFWRDFESYLEPKNCSKEVYLEELEELAAEVEERINCVRDELAEESK